MNEINENNYWYKYYSELDPREVGAIIKEMKIKSHGEDIHIDIYEQNEDPYLTLIFIHGTSSYGKIYSEFIFHLYMKGIRIITIDLKGHGKSTGLRGHFSIEEAIENIRDVTDFILGKYGENVGIIGSSLGGILSLYSVASDIPFKFAICHNIAIFAEKEAKSIIKLSPILKLFSGFLPVFSKILPKIRFRVFKYLSIERLSTTSRSKELMDVFVNDPLLADKYSLKALYTQTSTKLAKDIQKIEKPILILHGEKDGLFSTDYVKSIFDRLTCNKKMEIISDTGHFIFHEKIGLVRDIVFEWITPYL